jgi:hypothetical protein
MNKINEVTPLEGNQDGPQAAVDKAAVLVNDYDPTLDEDNPALFKEKEEAGLCQVMYTYAETFDYIIIFLSWIGTLVFAVATPASMGAWGGMMDSLGGAEGLSAIGTQALTMVVLGVILTVSACW